MLYKNTIILDGFIAGVYSDEELNEMIDRLARYYNVNKSDFIVTKENPYTNGMIS